MIKTITVTSTAIKNLVYDDTRQDLKVNFHSGRVYVYTPVSPEFFNKLNNSKSKGLFFNQHIRDNEALTCLKLIK